MEEDETQHNGGGAPRAGVDDVHAWSEAMRGRLEEWKQLGGRDLGPHPSVEEAGDCFQALAVHVEARPALLKMWNRLETRDPDLENASVVGILVETWGWIRECFPDLLPTLVDVLRETGTTCVQGDSHRLFALGLCALRMASSQGQTRALKILDSPPPTDEGSNLGQTNSVFSSGEAGINWGIVAEALPETKQFSSLCPAPSSRKHHPPPTLLFANVTREPALYPKSTLR